ncbi:hypothetical protein J6590_021707 [Homalodisca vitripennis]|nr:hypothetical protein J6590_021707 [Homalodisca vitripennis]
MEYWVERFTITLASSARYYLGSAAISHRCLSGHILYEPESVSNTYNVHFNQNRDFASVGSHPGTTTLRDSTHLPLQVSSPGAAIGWNLPGNGNILRLGPTRQWKHLEAGTYQGMGISRSRNLPENESI